MDTSKWMLMAAVSIQFALQPFFMRILVPSNFDRVFVSMYVEVFRGALCVFALLCNGSFLRLVREWDILSSLRSVGIPALLYAGQGVIMQKAYPCLDGITFNLLNQTKILFTAFFVYVIIGRPQSTMQILALCTLVLSGVLVNLDLNVWFIEPMSMDPVKLKGVLYVLASSVSSGFCAALSERILRTKRDTFLYSLEISVYGFILMFLGQGFTLPALISIKASIPVLLQASGGIMVGLLVKRFGSDLKGFAIVFGLLLTGVFQSIENGRFISLKHFMAVCIASFSLFVHLRNPPKLKKS